MSVTLFHYTSIHLFHPPHHQVSIANYIIFQLVIGTSFINTNINIMQVSTPAWELSATDKAKYDDMFRRVGGDPQGFISGMFSIYVYLC